MKKLLAVILTIVLLSIQLVLPLSATDISSVKQKFINDEVAKYMRVIMPNSSLVSVSDVFQIYDSATGNQTNEAVFVISDNEVIGMMVLDYIDGNYYSSYHDGVSEEIKNSYMSNASFALLAHNGTITPTNNSHYSTNNGNIHNTVFDVEYNTIISNNTVSIESAEAYSVIVEEFLPVPYIANGSVVVNGVSKGLCRLACISSIGSYLTDFDGLTPNQLFNTLQFQYNDIPTSTITWIRTHVIV